MDQIVLQRIFRGRAGVVHRRPHRFWQFGNVRRHRRDDNLNCRAGRSLLRCLRHSLLRCCWRIGCWRLLFIWRRASCRKKLALGVSCARASRDQKHEKQGCEKLFHPHPILFATLSFMQANSQVFARATAGDGASFLCSDKKTRLKKTRRLPPYLIHRISVGKSKALGIGRLARLVPAGLQLLPSNEWCGASGLCRSGESHDRRTAERSLRRIP